MPLADDGFPLDRLIHEPARLAILTVLSSVDAADFVFLARATGLTNGNLSSHLTKLEDAGLIRIEKRFVRKKPNTRAELTPEGKTRIATHWSQLERLKNLSAGPAQGPAARSYSAGPASAEPTPGRSHGPAAYGS